MQINDDLYEYNYDNSYNITDIILNGELINHYEYDNFNELIKEDNYSLNKTMRYTYDNDGNILKKQEYELNTYNLLHTDTYEYNNNNWKDQLTKYNDEAITYDAIGNPLTIGTKTLTWQNGRQLASYIDENQNITYSYNKDGIRTQKKVNNIITNYFTESNKIIFEQNGNNMIYYIRDEEGSLIGFKYNDTLYYYIKNMQEDIIGIMDSSYNLLCNYEYDSWGKLISIKDNNGSIITDTSHIGYINPFRYRSYYYDNETKLYYLNSRYYNPEWGRFINEDDVTGEIGNVLSHNMYLYSFNNPINNNDDEGDWPKWLKNLAIGAAAIAVGTIVTVVTGGAALPFIAAGVKTAVTVGVISAAVKTTMSVVQSASENKNVKETIKSAGSAALDGFSQGFRTGGTISAISSLSQLGRFSNGFKIGETSKPQYGRITIGYGSKSDRGMTIFNYSNFAGKSRLRLDADPVNMIHLHYGKTNSALKKHRKAVINIIFGVISGG